MEKDPADGVDEVLKGKLIYIHFVTWHVCVRVCCSHKYVHILYVCVGGNTCIHETVF